MQNEHIRTRALIRNYNWSEITLEDTYNFNKQYEWCQSKFKPSEFRARNVMSFLNKNVMLSQFVFKNEKDAVLFKMKWI